MNERSRVDKTSAEDKSIGFDYQYYYFLNELLSLKSGQTASYEVLDDVHIERADGKTLLVQLKHTVQKNAQGDPINLAKLDPDLWKSISNWCKVIVDPADGRSSVADQLVFLKNTSFLLVSNKSGNTRNSVLSSIDEFWNGTKSHVGFISDIRALKTKTKDETIKGYIDDLLNLDPGVSEAFLRNLSFGLGLDEIITRCKASILEKQIHPTRVDDVFQAVDSKLRENSFATVKAGGKISFSFEQFNLEYRRDFDKVRSEGFVIRNRNPALPANLSDQTFIKQLVDIDDIAADDVEILTKFTTLRLNFRDNVEQWIQDGDITQSDVDDLEQEADTYWENTFTSSYPRRQPPPDEAAGGAAARGIVQELRKVKLPLASQELPIRMSNGGFYELSDRPVMGWLHNWKDRYN
ncbi:hypothetical protein HLH33_18090 [Gluconacetobacter diazotrophicus]|uniref:CD-NTase associated protein 4-like DNA endonuclease domain-containing protein n=1 Tax=Gluconacetobacter diazotrophicus TaxID=33996 RepID=A0A7W4I8J8_GLUDI|nr:hypothetical protein [Gluconacetobacter diazotrophicus]MBB2158182.1 hypothetical protein [Gluconacetobacter diazotrophicus]